ncbi:MAG: succinate dehydrogenase/fumarate reductase iron-sulfur subunit [Deltaproteobacteria bacterium]|nr:MAG: succinate dehydrogenase/fumarate reductase iron-sulfur subunit [Deltaproteobacteria bacterium]
MHGAFVTENISGISPDMSFLEMLDILNDRILSRNDHPVCFESDCREGICGACSLVINGVAHGRQTGTTTCQLHMRSFKSGSTIVVEPFRARSFPVIRDLVVDRSALDRIMQAGGYISVNVGSAPDAHSILVDKKSADQAFEAAACIGCGACVAMCKNSSAMLFVGAKISQLSKLPQGQPERYERVKRMVEQMQVEGFGGCSNTMACEAVCPKGITTKVISELNWEFLKMTLKS